MFYVIRYSYVNGNPVNLTDPFGLESTSDTGVIPIPIPSPGTTDENSPPSKDIGEFVQGCYDAIDRMFSKADDDDKEHKKNKRPSTKDKHEKGRSRTKRDKGGEKGDDRRPYQR